MVSSLFQTFKPLLDRRFLTIFVLGFSSGFPWVIHGSVLTLWMQSEGQTRTAIGYVGSVTAVYALKWMWSPLVDRIRLPWLFERFGQRRSWILFTQALMIVFILLLSQSDPNGSLLVVWGFALGIALASATQDIVVDAYRILLFRTGEAEQKLAYSSAITTVGWLSGFSFIGGTLALFLGGESIGLSWPAVYKVLCLVYVLLMVLITLSPEPPVAELPAMQKAGSDKPSLTVWYRQTIVAPFSEFFARCGTRLALAILLFLVSFRIGEAMLGDMSLVFYVELGFTRDEIALYQKFYGGLATVIFSLLGAVINTRYGIMRGMLLGGIAMAASNLLYAVMAVVGPVPWLFLVTLVVDNFCSAFATVAVISFMSYFASRTYTGTQFALMVSFSNFGKTTLAASSGAIVDGLDGNWSLFFILTTLAVVPALCLLVWVNKLLTQYRAREDLQERPSALAESGQTQAG